MGTPDQDQVAERRSRAVKTALVLAAVAFAIFLAFVLSGVLKS
jgi:hypothetical protein